jgi:hypothetical protein
MCRVLAAIAASAMTYDVELLGPGDDFKNFCIKFVPWAVVLQRSLKS